MKRKIVISSFVLLTGSMLLLNSCKKDDDDTTPPVVTLNGSSSVDIVLNSSAYSDPGATATDDEDGSVTVTSDFSSTNPNLNEAKVYTITYTAHDAAGNTGTATRSVRVYNEAEDDYAGSYNVLDTCGGIPFSYTQTITADKFVNNRINFNKFADYAGNTGIFATMRGDGNIELPSQPAVGIGTSQGGACDVADHNFVSIGYSTPKANGFILNYTDAITSPSSCVGSTACKATFTRQ